MQIKEHQTRLYKNNAAICYNKEWLLPEAALIRFVSPDDEHDVLETCRELYIEKNLCITLVIYQEWILFIM